MSGRPTEKKRLAADPQTARIAGCPAYLEAAR